MIKGILGRLVGMMLTIWIAASLAFFALQVIPGDAITSQLVQSGVSDEEIADRRAVLGLTDPAWIRYLRFLRGIVQGDLGESLLSRESVNVALARNLIPTATLAISALVAACILGLLGGVLSALAIPLISPLSRLFTTIALSTPIYWTGTIAIFVFVAMLGLLPSGGAGRLSQLILPVMVLSFHTSGAIARVAQANMQVVLQADFIRTARAKGLSEPRVILAHAMRAALVPVMGVIALQAGFLLSGTVIVESLFVRPGVGRLLLDATIQQDYPVVLGVVVWSALIYSMVNLIADVLYPVFDPRVSF
jgi:peptide/nickel transport system permease protein